MERASEEVQRIIKHEGESGEEGKKSKCVKRCASAHIIN
jgi:hypothetical protein